MRVLIVGATGQIGSAIVGRLHAEGHSVVAVSRARGPAVDRLGVEAIVNLDIGRATRHEDWLDHLAGIDAVINCAGVLQDSGRDSTAGVHLDGVGALYQACLKAGIRKIVHVSAIGVDDPQTDFARTKLAGEEALTRLDLDWIILRPSVVLGRPAYGGSALFRGLASLPVLPLTSNTGELQVVWLDDLVATVMFFLRDDAPVRVKLDIVGPERLHFKDVVAAFRAWLGWRPADTFILPGWLSTMAFRGGDLLAWFGWRPPMRTTAQREIKRGAVGDPAPWTAMTGIQPRALSAALMSEPSSVQERWFAQLYFLKPVVFCVLAAFWVLTGMVSLGPGLGLGVDLMQKGGAGSLSVPTVIAGGLADLAIGFGIAFRRTARLALYAAAVITILYILAGTFLLPGLWADPLGPLMKVWPILALNAVALAILEDR